MSGRAKTSGAFRTREELEEFVLRETLIGTNLGAIARRAKISRDTVASLQAELAICKTCKAALGVYILVGARYIAQCPECGDCADPATSHRQALRNWHVVAA
jgi:hypothetical protein